MEKIKEKLEIYLNQIKSMVIYDDKRRRLMFMGLNVALAIVSFVMSVVNIFTKEYILMVSTLIFSFFCLLNILWLRLKKKEEWIYLTFGIEAMILLGFFFVSGIPNGFSALWICLIPSFALLIFGRRSGSYFCLLALGMMIFLFWIPTGKNLLQFAYTKTFMLRFPFLYTAMYAIALLVEYVRSETQRQLVKTEQKYRYLYRHDALTGLYNRYGINEYMDTIFKNATKQSTAVMILDIDDFKNVNDMYGHCAGDQVLKIIAEIPQKILCEHCQCCRWGGEEFLILMQCEHDPMEMAEKLRKYVEHTVIEYEGQAMQVTISIGVCIAKDISDVTISQVINYADRCLYEAKESGKNQIRKKVL